MAKKSWHEKLHIDHKPVVEVLKNPMGGFPAGASMLISTPLEFKKLIEKIPEGQRVTLREIREKLAKRYKADASCPLTSGIFLRIVAEAAWDEIEQGKDPGEVTPFWRAIGRKDPIVKKLRCGLPFLERMWKAEGIAA